RSGENSALRRVLITIALLAMVAVIGGVGWWWYLSGAKQVEPSIAAKDDPATPSMNIQQQEKALPAVTPPQPQTLPPPPQPQSLPPTPPSQIPAAEVPPTKSPVVVQSQPDEPPAQKSETPSIISAIPLLQDLPFGSQAAIPEMKFSGHAYSPNPDLRMIMVNTSIAREGDMITADVRLVEITENGLIMIFKDTLFRVDLF
ncbi:MAG: GspB domain-containing protein, partial [Desulfobacterales bacterium]|nr:GspB domain-containing protein [Desulfobacterales bacterium]